MLQLATLAKGAQKLISTNSPSILTAMAVAGVATTAILAGRASFQAADHLAEHAPSNMDLKEQVRMTWTLYIPAAAMGGATIACIIGANTISTRRQAALMSVYSLTETAFKEYREKATEVLGEKKEQQVRDDIAQDRVDRNPVSSSQVFIGKGPVLCYEVYTGRYFKSNMDALKKAENTINAMIINDMYASQNDLNQLIGLPMTKIGDELGWNTDRLLELDIQGVVSEDGEPALSVDYRVEPKRGFHRFGG